MIDDSLMHYGTPRHSGRYPWGSGDDPYQRNRNFVGYVTDLRKKGVSDVDIAKAMGINTKQLRAKYSMAKDEKRMADAAEAFRLKEKGYSNVAIAKRMGLPNESSVRSLLDPSLKAKSEKTMATANALKDQVDKKGYIDIGVGVEHYLGVSRTKLDTSVAMLQEKGYTVHNVKVKQLGTGKLTTVKVLAPPNTNWADVNFNKDKIKSVECWTSDKGATWDTFQKPVSVSSDRVMVRYGKEGGVDKDGVIELRRGVEDISLGKSNYAQVRIAVDGTHYLKGMAVYSDNMPKGVDIIFNTNKNDVSKLDAMKPIKKTKDGEADWENPFGATVKQQTYTGKDGKKHLSAVNIVNEQGDWEKWKKTLSSQMLSKQEPALAQKQLALALDSKKAEYEEIMACTNPVVKKKLLDSFADNCDASSVHLEAAAMPRQASHVILPLTTIKDNEVYAPQYRDGEKVVLIRYPHAGIFEIPELTVNNRNPEGKKMITPESSDAIGISSKVAGQLSGADFDGDTVLVIPKKNQGSMSIKSSTSLDQSAMKHYEGLKTFDTKASYPGYEGMTKMTKRQKGIEMGKVSNLITDMTVQGAPPSEIARAVRYSMVVIDAEKHGLNYKQAYVDNNIGDLQKKYQKRGGGASTLISKASSEQRVETRRVSIDPKTGKKVYTTKETDIYVDKKGNTVHRTESSTKMAEVEDAFELSSGTPIETIYARHANSLKALANQARKDSMATKNPKMSAAAKETYADEVANLKANLNIALKNAPKERQAQLLANAEVSAKKAANPNMDSDDIKKLESRALERARAQVGAGKKDVMVPISNKEWEAIQAGAVSANTLTKILNNTDQDRIKELAMPRQKATMSSSRVSRAKMMLNAGCTLAEVADQLGVSVSTLNRAIK